MASGTVAPADRHQVAATSAKAPVVVELFQSQGCSDCPPAQIYLNRLADRPDLLALSFAVTYWDQLGWKDRFASPQYTQRQRDYSARNGGAGVATPQFWIDGRETVLGADIARVEQAIARGAPTGGPAIALANDTVELRAGAAPAGGADVWLVRYDPRTISVSISAGENDGKTILHRDIVRELTPLGRWTGSARTLSIPVAKTPGLRTAILVQEGRGGPIIAAAKA